MTTASSLYRTSASGSTYLQISLLAVFFTLWTSTLIGTTDLANWMLENTLVFLFLAVLVAGSRYFRFSDTSHVLIFLYLCLHVYGAQHTYALNPFGFWLQEHLGLARNPYDRLVHFSFGFLLAYPMRDLFRNYFGFPLWVCWLLPAEVTLSFSGLYELIEWGVADLFFPEQGAAYLGSQGDVWDAQKDMGLATAGAVLAMLGVGAIKKLNR